jgi:multidrug efflux pump subunit AcrB
MFKQLLQNHVLSSLSFLLVIILGWLSYQNLPRQQDPSINFNWIAIFTTLAGASAEDIEKQVTEPLEEAIRSIPDLRFVSSNSRENVSSLLVRFNDIEPLEFDKRIADLRRKIEGVKDQLPPEVTDPNILELTSSTAFPAAMIAVIATEDDENLRINAKNIRKDLEQIKGVHRVDAVALDEPEIQIQFSPQRLEALHISPTALSDSLKSWYQDIAAGTLEVQGQSWLVRLAGKTTSADTLAQLPIQGIDAEVPLAQIASIERTRNKSTQDVRIDGKAAILFSILKQDNSNILQLVDRLQDYIDSKNTLQSATAVKLTLIDDQTIPTREAIRIMQSNALIGLLMVLLVAWIFLGSRIAFLTAIAIPFTLAGTFWILANQGQTLNVSVLLAVVIVLGMLVDDAVVIVEAIYYRLQRGMNSIDAAMSALKEVALPVTTAVLTTMAIFLPLMLLPGILGQFMKVIPIVVTIALAISLIEAFWMLPSHIHMMNINFDKPSRTQRLRTKMTRWIQRKYSYLLIKILRYPKLTLSTVFLSFLLAVGIISAGLIKMDFFASDALRIFYVSIEMPSNTPLNKSLQKSLEVESVIRRHLKSKDARSIAAYAGLMFTETEPLYGTRYAQIVVSLKPVSEGSRPVADIVEGMRTEVMKVTGADSIFFVQLKGGPPAEQAINVKVRGDDYAEVLLASEKLRSLLKEIGGFENINDDSSPARKEFGLALNYDAIRRVGINANEITRILRLLVDGEVIANVYDKGEKVDIRVKAQYANLNDIKQLLNIRIPTPDGSQIALSELLHAVEKESLGNIRHYNFRRTITLSADLKKHPETAGMWNCQIAPAIYATPIDYSQCDLDTVVANQRLLTAWNTVQADYPTIDLNFSGQLDDIKESLNQIGALFIMGVGLMYLIMGTQFRSFFQPLMILSTVPMAFTGVIFGLLLTQNPMSLYTLYGIVALAGIAVNAAIVLISAANDRRNAGMSICHATVYAARRRVIPILITSLTTIAGLFSLATGIGGESLLWGPVATAIVWGVGFSTVLTLIVIPTLYRISMRSKMSHKP